MSAAWDERLAEEESDEARRERVLLDLDDGIDYCPGCGKPCHATEGDSDGYHPGCRPGKGDDTENIRRILESPSFRAGWEAGVAAGRQIGESLVANGLARAREDRSKLPPGWSWDPAWSGYSAAWDEWDLDDPRIAMGKTRESVIAQAWDLDDEYRAEHEEVKP